MMRVVSSQVVMASQQQYSQVHSRTERLEAWVGERPRPGNGPAAAPGTGPGVGGGGVLLHISEGARQRLQEAAVAADEAAGAQAATDERLDGVSLADRIKILLIEKLFKMTIKVPRRVDQQPPAHAVAVGQATAPGQQPVGWGIHYERHEQYHEREQLSFAAAGVIKTADGKEIAFTVELNMSREFYQESHFEFRAGDAQRIDPLVINFDGPSAQLSGTRFAFDLDLDGRPDQVPLLGPGSGFLAVDWNRDGLINDGAELFGPRSGDGFADLAAHDEDGNGWIDEGDSIFERLRIWTRNEAGEQSLFSLGQKGIGAIYLGSVAAPFTVKDGQNQALGQFQKAGIFVRENGTAGTVQHLDVLV